MIFLNIRNACLLIALLLSSCLCLGSKKESVDIGENKIGVQKAASNSDLPSKSMSLDEKEIIHRIRQFYGYVVSEDPSLSMDSIMKRFMTTRAIEKLKRVTQATGASPLLRAQDHTDDFMETLQVTHLTDHWYLVCYNSGKSATTEIPLKVKEVNGVCMIDYVTPVWNGSLYGDSVLCSFPSVDLEVLHSSSLSFLQSFYDAYTMEYSCMPDCLAERLHSLRSQYLTENALSQFESVRQTVLREDGCRGYDLLIGNFDFDCLWRSSIEITECSEHVYRMSYKMGTFSVSIELKVIERCGRYYIDSVKS